MAEENTEKKVVAETTTDPKEGADPSKETVPWDKDERWQQWKKEEATLRPAVEKLNKLLEANDLDGIEDLVELVESGKKVKGKLQDPEMIDALIAKANKLERIEAYWKDQGERKKREEEDPEETIKRLESQLKERKSVESEERKTKELAEESKKAVVFYESSVGSLIEDISMPKEQKVVLAEFLGIGNVTNEIDITDKKAIKKAFQDAVKKFEDYDQFVIKQYLAGKSKVPIITKTEPVVDTEKKPKNLKEARAAFKERMTSMFKEKGG